MLISKISVLIRLYNGIEFLEESLRSVLDQTYANWEVLIGINGHGPTGGEVLVKALQIASNIAKGDPRIRVINFPFVKGGAEAMNVLAKEAASDWVAILDVDDKWHPDKLMEQVLSSRSLMLTPDVIGTQCEYIGDMKGRPRIPLGYIDVNYFKMDNPIVNSSVLIRKSLLHYTDLFNLDDYDLWCRLALNNKVFYNIDSVLTYHRVHKNSFYNSSRIQDPDALRRHHFSNSP
jgi:teichuronic acid biosynthesis glycosyltransferase TuaG